MERMRPPHASTSSSRSSNHHDNGEHDDIEKKHLNWSKKQSHILTADGKAIDYYSSDSFTQDELPHYYLMMANPSCNETYTQFRIWKQQQQQHQPTVESSIIIMPIVGAWYRTIFVGGWEYSSDQEERVFNLQSQNLFIDMRIPISRDVLLSLTIPTKPDTTSLTSWDDCSDGELRILARQHVFAGFTRSFYLNNNHNNNSNSTIGTLTSDSPYVICDHQWYCTRHHCLDWNLIHHPRPRPNKWYVQLRENGLEFQDNDQRNNLYRSSRPVHQWKEYAFATDPHGQHYYMEQWNRLPTIPQYAGSNNNNSFNKNVMRKGGISYVLALRKVPLWSKELEQQQQQQQDDHHHKGDDDGIFIIVDGYFSYIRGCQHPKTMDTTTSNSHNEIVDHQPTLVDLVDTALSDGRRDIALAYLQRIEACHGIIFDTISHGHTHSKPSNHDNTNNSNDNGEHDTVGHSYDILGEAKTTDMPTRWMVQYSIPPWKQGSAMLNSGDIRLEGASLSDCRVFWSNDEEWEIFDCQGFESIAELQQLFLWER